MTQNTNSDSPAQEADAGEEAYKEIRKECAAVTADLEHAQKRWEAELSASAAWQHRAKKAEAENSTLQDKLKLAELWRTGYEQAKADRIEAQKLGMQAMDENAALRENSDAMLQRQMDITMKEYKRAEKAEAENAALREPIPAEDAMRIVLEWYDSDQSGVELIRRAEAWKYPKGKQRTSLLEDAERYRWFRSKRLWDSDSFPWPVGFEYPEPCLWDDGEMLDAAIDAVRKV